jgi:hypothetical protein
MQEGAMRMKYGVGLAVIAAVAASSGITGCYHATELGSTWHDRKTQSLEFHKTVAIFMSSDQALRRTVEDHLAARYPNAVPSYTIFPDFQDPTAALAQLQQSGYDGAILMRVTDVETTNYVPGYDDGYPVTWGSSWGHPYDPSYVVSDRIVSVETQIFALDENKLVFTASSETTNPANMGKLTDSVMRHVMDRLKKDGLIK